MSKTNFGQGHAAQAQEAPVRGSGDGYSLRSRSVDASATVGHRRPTPVRYPKGPESTLDTEIEFGNVIEQQNSTHTSQNFTILPWPQQFVTWRVAYTCRPYHRRWENCILFLIALLCLLLCSIYAVLFTGSRIAQRHVLYISITRERIYKARHCLRCHVYTRRGVEAKRQKFRLPFRIRPIL